MKFRFLLPFVVLIAGCEATPVVCIEKLRKAYDELQEELVEIAEEHHGIVYSEEHKAKINAEMWKLLVGSLQDDYRLMYCERPTP